MITIKNLERETATGGVTIVHYGVELTDGDYSASSYGTVSVTPDSSDPSFVPFDELTEATVIGWVESAIDVAAVEASLSAHIEDQKAPKSETGLPW
jgi:hypothetical protein